MTSQMVEKAGIGVATSVLDSNEDRENCSLCSLERATNETTESEDLNEIQDQREQKTISDARKPLSWEARRYLIIAIVVLVATFTGGVVLASRTRSSSDTVPGSAVTESDPFAPTPTPPLASPFYISFPVESPTPYEPSSVGNPDEYTVVLASGKKMLPGDKVLSPNKLFTFVMAVNGDLILYRSSNGDVLWQVQGEGAAYLSMQSGGNLVLRKADTTRVWRSTTNSPGSFLKITNDGQIALVKEDESLLWFAGIPRGTYTAAPPSLTFPIRGAFYYPWFPETWTVRGNPIQFNPTLGLYSNDDADLQDAHVAALEYAHIDLAIASWWGPNQKLDRARITNLMDKSAAHGIKWTVYHEEERQSQPTVDQIRYDLDYLKKWFVWHESWGHIDGKPLIFVWNHNSCEVSERWMEAAQGEWYVVPKLWGGHDDCPTQPNSWHQYGPAKPVVNVTGYSFSVSPGFYHATAGTPRLERVSIDDFTQNTQDMVKSKEPWQLITTFNEWGEGTAVESAEEWATESGFGAYLDVLHEIQ